MELSSVIERQKYLLNYFLEAFEHFSTEKNRVENEHNQKIKNANSIKQKKITDIENNYQDSIKTIEKYYTEQQSHCSTFLKIVNEMWLRLSQELGSSGLSSWCVPLDTISSKDDDNLEYILSKKLPASINKSKEALGTCSTALSKYREYLKVKKIILIGLPVVLIGALVYLIIITSNFIKVVFNSNIGPKASPISTLSSPNPVESVKNTTQADKKDFQQSQILTETIQSLETKNPLVTPYQGDDGEIYVKQMLKYAATDNGGVNSDSAIVDTAYVLNRKFPCPKQQYIKEARAANKEALRLIQTSTINQALQKFQEAYDIDPTDIEIINNLGYGYLKAGNYQKAETFLLHTLIYEPGRSSAWANLGELYAKIGDLQSAKAAFANTLRFSRDPYKTIVFFNSLMDKNDNQNIREVARFALQLPYIEPTQLKFCSKGD